MNFFEKIYMLMHKKEDDDLKAKRYRIELYKQMLYLEPDDWDKLTHEQQKIWLIASKEKARD